VEFDVVIEMPKDETAARLRTRRSNRPGMQGCAADRLDRPETAALVKRQHC
jgi:hypothetical protein